MFFFWSCRKIHLSQQKTGNSDVTVTYVYKQQLVTVMSKSAHMPISHIQKGCSEYYEEVKGVHEGKQPTEDALSIYSN